MRSDVKEILYMMMDFLDSMVKTSKNNSNIIKIDEVELKEVKQEIFSLINSRYESHNYNNSNHLSNYKYLITNKTQNEKVNAKKKELIGALPTALIDRNLFPKNEDVAKLLEKSLNFKIDRWSKIKREEIIGHVISEIAKRDEEEIELFLNAWNEFEKENIYKNQQNNIEQNNFANSGQQKDFVDIWLDFFDKYKGGKV